MLSFLGTERLKSCTAVDNEEAKPKKMQQCSHTALMVSAPGNDPENKSGSKPAFEQEVFCQNNEISSHFTWFIL